MILRGLGLLAQNPTFETFGLLIREFLLKVSTFISLGFGPVSRVEPKAFSPDPCSLAPANR